MAYSMLDGPDYGQNYDYSGGFQPQQQQPDRPSFLQAFQGGMQQGKGKRKNSLMAGLAGEAGSGGFMGGVGNVAKFLL